MEKCYRGCGLDATYFSKKTGWRCHKSSSKCPVVKNKIGKSTSVTSKGRKQTPESRKKQSETLKRKYKSGELVMTEDRKQKIRESNIEHWNHTPRTPWNKGLTGAQEAWNKGLRKTEDPSVLDRDNPIYKDFRKYRNRVSTRTERTYTLHEAEINPNGYTRAKAGVVGAYHLDHIVSVRQGFELGLPVEALADKRNLQMLPWEENISKYDNKGKRVGSSQHDTEKLIQTLLKEYKEK